MSDTSGYVNLDYIAAHVTVMGDDDDRFYEKKLQLAIDGYKALNISILPSVKVVYLTVTAQNTALFPDDMDDYILIGINNGGRIWTLTRNLNLVLPATESCGVWNRDPIITGSNENSQTSGYYYSDHDHEGQTISGAYAVGGGFNSGYYRIDYANRQIVLLTNESYAGNSIILEYTSSGISGNTIIPLKVVPYLTTYCDWQLAKHDRTENMNRVVMLRSDWRTQRDLLKAKIYTPTMDEFLDAKYLSLSRGVKR
jgi:hypothetical protein